MVRYAPWPLSALPGRAKAALDVGVISTNNSPLTVTDDGAMTTDAGTNHADDRQDRTNDSHNHQNDTNGADIETVLVRARSDSKIKDRPHSKGDDTRN